MDIDKQMKEELEAYEKGERPSPFGELKIDLDFPPVSQQTNKRRKVNFVNRVRQDIAKYKFYLTGEVQISIEWLLHERSRYESDKAADTDNIIKPSLDSIIAVRLTSP